MQQQAFSNSLAIHIKRKFHFLQDYRFWLFNGFIPLCLLYLYSWFFLYFSNHFINKGVTYFFVVDLMNWLHVLLPTILILILLLAVFKNKEPEYRIKNNSFPSPLEFILLLLPLAPIMQYIVTNHRGMPILDSVLVFLFFLVFSGLFVLLIPALFKPFGNSLVAKSLGLAFTLSITNMAIMSHILNWWEKGDQKIQLVFFGSVFLIVFILLQVKNRWILYGPIVFLFISSYVINMTEQVIRDIDSRKSAATSSLPAILTSKTHKKTPNVYLLIYDAYVPEAVMRAYGIDNTSQIDILTRHGFQIFPYTYTLYADTLHSMGSVLSISNSFAGNLNSGVAGYGVVTRQFKQLGYTTYGIFPSDYMFRNISPAYDHYIPRTRSATAIYLIASILIGEFRFDIGFNNDLHAQFIEEKQDILKDAAEGQSFLYMHTNLPNHSQNSGECLRDETDLYRKRLAFSNREMRLDIDTILKNDPGAVIIIAGDHGPYLTKNCIELTGHFDRADVTRMDILDRYSTFLAIKWPEEDVDVYNNIIILQDIFPTVFAYLYEDTSILDARLEPIITDLNVISGVSVIRGVIDGGVNDGEKLFLEEQQ